MAKARGDDGEARLIRPASLWIGGNLSWLEQLCIKSFLDHGHDFTLYTYEGVTNAPPGTLVEDANAIFPARAFITHRASGSPAVHADAFRYRMIARTGMAWVDVDVLCMQPWRHASPFLFGWEKTGRVVCNAVLALPADSRTLARLNDFCAEEFPVPPWAGAQERDRLEAARAAGTPVHVSDLAWGVWGPAAVTWFLTETGEIDEALPQQAFYPIPFKDRRDLLAPDRDVTPRLGGAACLGVHLWNRRLRRRLVTHHGGVPHPDSFLGRAVTRHGIDCTAAPIPDVPPASVLAARAAAEAAAVPGAPAPSTAAPDPVLPDMPADDPPAPVRSQPAPVPPRLLRDTAEPAADAVQDRPPEALAGMAVRAPVHAVQRFRRLSDGLEALLNQAGPWLAPPKEAPARDTVLVVTAMKNEAPFILEWIAYNRVIGVDHFLVYTNDCSDNTVAMLDRLAETGIVTRIDNPCVPGGKVKPQHAALKDATRQKVFRQADWIVTIDLDEFIAVHVGDGTLQDLFRASNHPNAISLTWKFFGNGGVIDYADRPVIAQFTRCAPEMLPDPGLAWGFKTMFNRRSCRFRKLGVHRPAKMAQGGEAAVRWVNGSGRVMPKRLIERGWRTVQPIFGYRLATLNHYALRSAESYLVKRDRGRINHTDQDQGVYYWQRRNYITEDDRRLLWMLPRVEEELARLKSDPVLAALHDEAVAWHRDRIARLKADADYARVFAELVRSAGEDATHFAKLDPTDELKKAEAPPAPVPHA
jgi:hypothetical protein